MTDEKKAEVFIKMWKKQGLLMVKLNNEKKYYANLCHKKTVECDDLRKGMKQFQSDNEKFIKRIDELEKEIAELKEKYESNKNPLENILELKSQIVRLNEYARSICKNRTDKKKCKHNWDCSNCIKWEMK